MWTEIAHAADARLDPFRDLRRGSASVDLIVEGELAVHRALAAGMDIRTVVAVPSYAERLRECVAAQTDVLVAPPAVLRALTGFDFHRGILAVGPRPRSRVTDALARACRREPRLTVVLAVGIADPSNLGALVRCARAFGADAVVYDLAGADPWSRRAIRASAGLVFEIPLVAADLRDPRTTARDWCGELALVATVPRAHDTVRLCDVQWPARVGIMVGNEGHGLSQTVVDAAELSVCIELAPAVDSLNVACAAAIVLWSRAQALRVGSAPGAIARGGHGAQPGS